MRVALITQDFPPDTGGIETYANELAKRLAQWCDDFTVYAPGVDGAGHDDQLFDFAVKRFGRFNSLLNFSLLPFLPNEVYRKNIEVCFHTQWQTVISSIFARQISGYPKKIFTAAHARELLYNPYENTPASPFFLRYRSRIFDQVDHWFPVSRYTRDILTEQGISDKESTVIRNGTDPDRFYPFDASGLRRELGLENRKILLTITRLVQRKGIDDVIKVIDHIKEDIPEIAYVVVGQGPKEAALKEMVSRRNLESYVYFHGEVSHESLPRYYNMCDVFVMPSRTAEPDVEGFGIVFLEANACAKPVIGTDSGGIPDAVLDKETGLIINERDSDQLSRAIRWMLEEPQQADKLGRQGRKRVEQDLNWEEVADKLYRTMKNKINS